MPVKRTIVAAAAALALVGGAAMAATFPAHAETPSCGPTCIDLYGGYAGATLGHPSFMLSTYKQGQATGTPIVLFPVSNVDPSEDFTVRSQAPVSSYYDVGIVSAAVDQLYGDDTAFEIAYSPFGDPIGQCVGVAATPVAGEHVTLQQCGVDARTLWFGDPTASLNNSFVPLINAATPDAADPFVLTYPAGADPDAIPRTVLEVDQLQENAAGKVPVSQLWSALYGTLASSDADLSIAQPANITTDATGPSGATVTYPLPAVSDFDDTPPTAVCTPAPGSAFPNGTTTVTCTATDADDLGSPVHTTFTVTVLGAAAQLASLRQAVHNLGFGNFLTSTIAIAQRQLSAGHPFLACLTLSQFILEVRLQTPWSIPASTAALLIADAKRIQAVLGGCGHLPPF